MDICELVWGSRLFLDVVDHPEMVHDFLALVTETYTAYMRAWKKVIPFQTDGNVHWGMLHKGTIMLRDDSGTNFSRRMYEKFILPYDQRLLNEFGGGAIHFCGKGDHFITLLGEMHGLHAVQLSQPHLNDMSKVYQHTVDRGIKLIGLGRSAAENARLAAFADGCRWLVEPVDCAGPSALVCGPRDAAGLEQAAALIARYARAAAPAELLRWRTADGIRSRPPDPPAAASPSPAAL